MIPIQLLIAFGFCLVRLGVLSESVEHIQDEDNPDIHSDSINVCVDQVPETRVVNVTYMQSVDVVEYEWCLRVPPKCPVYRQKLVEVVKQENVSRVVNYRKCCRGFSISSDKHCEPVCESSCEHGFCVQPNVCSCSPGFTGQRCEKFGCPDGNWGPDCSKPCPCKNGGSCEPHTGKCLCLPGWSGHQCQDICDSNHFGPDCSKTCNCAASGERCYHVTGDCLQCPSGTFGPNCDSTCSCNANGTALCYHLNGNCFCHSNWYGHTCDLFCPFGYLNGVCYKQPMNNGTNACSCPGEMYECDLEVGCVCRDEQLCKGGQQIFSLAPLAAPSDESSTSSSSVAIIVVVLIIALLGTILGVWYYKRKTQVLEKDLQNRSVYYVEDSILDPSRHHQVDLITQNPGTLVIRDEYQRSPAVPRSSTPVASGAAAMSNNLNVPNNLISRPRYEKNVNLEAYKLGRDHERPTEGACRSETPTGACGGPESEPELEATFSKPSNINMFDDDYSKKATGKAQSKIQKTTINSVIRNNLEDSDHEMDGDAVEEDDVAIAKMSNYLDSYTKK